MVKARGAGGSVVLGNCDGVWRRNARPTHARRGGFQTDGVSSGLGSGGGKVGLGRREGPRRAQMVLQWCKVEGSFNGLPAADARVRGHFGRADRAVKGCQRRSGVFASNRPSAHFSAVEELVEAIKYSRSDIGNGQARGHPSPWGSDRGPQETQHGVQSPSGEHARRSRQASPLQRWRSSSIHIRGRRGDRPCAPSSRALVAQQRRQESTRARRPLGSCGLRCGGDGGGGLGGHGGSSRGAQVVGGRA